MTKRTRRKRPRFSEVVAEAARLLRQREAQERLLASFGADALVTAEQAEEIRALWREPSR